MVSTTKVLIPVPRRVRSVYAAMQTVVGDVAVRDEHLGAVDHVVVALARGGGADRRGVGARVGLRQPPASELLAAQRGHQVLALLRIGAEPQERDASEPDVRQERRRESTVHACDLLDQEAAHHHVAAAAAVFLGIADAEIAEAAELAEQVQREGLGALQLLDARGERLLREAAHRDAERVLFVVQGEAEHGVSLRAAGHSRRDPPLSRHAAPGRGSPVLVWADPVTAVRVEDIGAHDGERVTLRGWLAARRSSGKIHFLQLRDGTRHHPVRDGKERRAARRLRARRSPPPGERAGGDRHRARRRARSHRLRAGRQRSAGAARAGGRVPDLAQGPRHGASCSSTGTCGCGRAGSTPCFASAPRSSARAANTSTSTASSASTRRSSPPPRARAPPRCSPWSTSARRRTSRRAVSSTARPGRSPSARCTSSVPPFARRSRRRDAT